MTCTAALWILTREETNGAKEWGGQCGHHAAICSPPAYNPTGPWPGQPSRSSLVKDLLN